MATKKKVVAKPKPKAKLKREKTQVDYRVTELERKGSALVEALRKALPGPVAKEIRKIAAE